MPPRNLSAARSISDPHSLRAEALVESYRRLAEVFHDVLSEQSLDSLLDRIADTLGELIPYDALHIYEADATAGELVPVFARSDWAEEILRTKPAFGQGITGWAVVHGEPVLSNQAHLDPRVAFVPGTPPDPEALISVPLVARGALKGALNIYRLGEAAAFSEEEFELAKWFGDAAALAVDNAQVRARLELQAQTDSLTGLYNHRHFHERLRSELTRASRARDSVALLMFDIDEFKRVNDICGHAVGDQILIAVGDAARQIVRRSDVVCRLGGEEFGIIMPSCDAGDALGLARRLMERLELRPIDAAGEVTLSIGVAQGPEHAMNARELVACAETAMMTAKVRGKNRIVIFSEETAERPAAFDGGRDVRSIAHLKMLQSLSGKLNRLRDVREIGQAIVNELRMLIDYHTCRVYLVEGQEAYPIASRGDLGSVDGRPIDPPAVKLGEGMTGYVAASGRPLLVANALECEHALQIPGTEPIDESVIAAPLRSGTRVVGVVFLSKLGIGQFDEDDLRLLEVLAGHAAVVLENARLYEAMRCEAENAKAWLDFTDALSHASGVGAICEETVQRVAALLGIDQCSLWLQDPRHGDFYCAAAHGYEGDPGAEESVDRRVERETGERFLADTKTPFVMTADDLRRSLFGGAASLALRGVACAPLPAGYGVRGWLAVGEPEDDLSRFTDVLLRLLDGIAYRASTALQKATLYREQQESAEIASALLEFARELATAESLASKLERAVELTARMVGSPRTSLWLETEDGALVARAVFGYTGGHLQAIRALSLSAELTSHFLGTTEPFVLTPEIVEGWGIVPFVPGVRWAVAPLPADHGRKGCIVAAAPEPGDFEFPAAKLRLLVGLADQARLALAAAG